SRSHWRRPGPLLQRTGVTSPHLGEKATRPIANAPATLQFSLRVSPPARRGANPLPRPPPQRLDTHGRRAPGAVRPWQSDRSRRLAPAPAYEQLLLATRQGLDGRLAPQSRTLVGLGLLIDQPRRPPRARVA